MRVGIINEVYNLMKKDQNIYFLTGDLGYTAVEQIEQDFPKRFINVGIAEQNMVGIAAGLALSGKKVYIYSIISFLLMRCFEQIRYDLCFHDLDVTLLGIGGGLSYGYLSGTHFALEDIALMKVLPNMSIFSPADEVEGRLGIKALHSYRHPLYVRIGKRQEPMIYSKPYRFHFGKGVVLRRGKDACIFATGPIIDEVIKAVDSIRQEEGIHITVVNIHTLKPLDQELVMEVSSKKKVVFSVEEHSRIGGLGSTIAELFSGKMNPPRLVRIGTPDTFIKELGSQDYLRKKLGLSTHGIISSIKREGMKL